MIADAEAWLQACKGMLNNDGSQPFLFPHFPGFHKEAPFQCDLIFGDTWRETIKVADFKTALAEPEFYDRVKKVVQLYSEALETIAAREPQPQVVLCCIPQEVVDTCTIQRGRRARPRKLIVPKTSSADRRQLSFFDVMDARPAPRMKSGAIRLSGADLKRRRCSTACLHSSSGLGHSALQARL